MFYFDPLLMIATLPAVLLMAWAQYKLRSAYSHGMQISTPLTGHAAALHILESEGVHDVGIEETYGELSDHYDPRDRVLRLSSDVYHSRSATAVGIAAHEAGHALQHAHHYAPLALRNMAVPAAQFGGTAFTILVILAFVMHQPGLLLLGLIAYGATVVFQLINLPVEYDASARAKRHLGELGIVDGEGAAAVKSVLSAAALTYVAATLQSLLTLIYYGFRFLGGSRSDE